MIGIELHKPQDLSLLALNDLQLLETYHLI
jgi:hypothetical protein